MHLGSLAGLTFQTGGKLQASQLNGRMVTNFLEIHLWNMQSESLSFCFDSEKEIPDIDQAQFDPDHFCLYLYVPVGDGEDALLTQMQAEQVILLAPPGWIGEQVLDSGRYGVYWVLHPSVDDACTEIIINANQGMTIILSQMTVCWEKEGMSVLGLRCGSFALEQEFLPLFVRYPEPVASFLMQDTFSGILDKASFTWQAEGSLSKLYFLPDDTEPNGTPVALTGEKECTIYDTVMYALLLELENEKHYCFCPVILQEPEIISFAPDRTQINFGQSVQLDFILKHVRHGYLSELGRVECTTIQTDGSAHASGTVRVQPYKKKSRYRLYCLAENALLMKECTVEILDFLTATVSFLPFDDPQGYLYRLNWSTENMLTISLRTSDGTEHSSGAASGSKSFINSTVLTLHVKVTGTGDQILEYDY